jgi:hypothetical protein
LHLVDYEGVGGDPGRRHVNSRRQRSEGHRRSRVTPWLNMINPS